MSRYFGIVGTRNASVVALGLALALGAPSQSSAQQSGGTADEARAMLMKAAAAVKADKAKALDMFNKGEGGFLDRDFMSFAVMSAMGNPLQSATPTPSN